MSDFDVLFGHSQEALNQVFAEAVTYTPATGGGAPVAVQKAIVSPEYSEEYGPEDGRRRRRVRFVSIVTDSTHPNYSGVADPKDNATVTVTVGGVATEYSIAATANEGHGVAVLKVIRVGQVEKSRQNLRERR